MTLFCKSLEEIKERISKACWKSSRKKEEITLLGASKGVSWEIMSAFYGCGLKTFGENKVQEFLKKYENLK
ncbi:MAG: YggS family pyridoxal phosphate enzyme, partial [Aquificaceae bacterium]